MRGHREQRGPLLEQFLAVLGRAIVDVSIPTPGYMTSAIEICVHPHVFNQLGLDACYADAFFNVEGPNRRNVQELWVDYNSGREIVIRARAPR